MAIYRLYYCKEDVQRFSAHHFQAVNDADAIDHADQRLTPLHAPIYELWQGDRLVLRWDRHNPLIRQRLQKGAAPAADS